MAIQINVNRFFPAALVILRKSPIDYFPLAADTKIETGWEVYKDRQDRDDSNPPEYSFGVQFSIADINPAQNISTLRLQLETALRNRCIADPNVCGNSPRGRAVRNAILTAGAAVPN